MTNPIKKAQRYWYPLVKEKWRIILLLKKHAKVDSKKKFIKKFAVKDASVHDSQVSDDLLDKLTKANHCMETVLKQEKNRKKKYENIGSKTKCI